MKLGIAISCYIGHIPKLWELLDALNIQTVLPNKVVVSCSSTETIQIPKKYQYPLFIVITPEYKNAAENRNIAIRLLQDMDYISFIDADDLPHFQRNECILTVIKENNSDIIMHNYTTTEKHLITTPLSSLHVNHHTLEKCYSGCIKHIDFFNNRQNLIHHSQSTVKKSICDQIQYNEAKTSIAKEDAEFCSAVFSLPNIKHSYIYNQLSYYVESRTYEQQPR